jgi:hypothetical protein
VNQRDGLIAAQLPDVQEKRRTKRKEEEKKGLVMIRRGVGKAEKLDAAPFHPTRQKKQTEQKRLLVRRFYDAQQAPNMTRREEQIRYWTRRMVK